ncbi:MAG: hypothetical protein ACP5D0_07645 [Hydrogenovibrio sp.]
MYSIGLEDVGSALLITIGMVLVSVTIVGLAMWWLHGVFKNPEASQPDKHSETSSNENGTAQSVSQDNSPSK